MLNRQGNWRASMHRQASVKRPSKSEVSESQRFYRGAKGKLQINDVIALRK
jgi:hypothetical protein